MTLSALMRERVPLWSDKDKAQAREVADLITEAFGTSRMEASRWAFWWKEFQRLHSFTQEGAEMYAHALSAAADALAPTVNLKDQSTDKLMKAVAPFVLWAMVNDYTTLDTITEAGKLRESVKRLTEIDKSRRRPTRRVA